MRSEKLAVITGAGTGIGRALAEELIKRGHFIFAIGRRTKPLEELQKDFPGKVEYLSVDISDKEAPNKIIYALAGRKIDFLVHNAAIIEPFNDLMSASNEDLEKIMSINFYAPFFLTKALVPYLKNDGRILQISSGAAHTHVPGVSAYCISKAALYALYKNLQPELLKRNVYLGSADPGVVDTDMQLDVRLNQKYNNIDPRLRQKMKALIITPQAVAKFLAWLLCDVDPELFSKKEWEVYDESHHPKWLSSPLQKVNLLPEDDPKLQ